MIMTIVKKLYAMAEASSQPYKDQKGFIFEAPRAEAVVIYRKALITPDE